MIFITSIAGIIIVLVFIMLFLQSNCLHDYHITGKSYTKQKPIYQCTKCGKIK